MLPITTVIVPICYRLPPSPTPGQPVFGVGTGSLCRRRALFAAFGSSPGFVRRRSCMPTSPVSPLTIGHTLIRYIVIT